MAQMNLKNDGTDTICGNNQNTKITPMVKIL